jgi:NTP pyrophosphatase (non-canonical NTP hydrolase)
MVMKCVYENALSKFGFYPQLEILQEECAELIQAVSKLKRADKSGVGYQEAYTKLIHEICDVQILLNQCRVMFDANDIDAQMVTALEHLCSLLQKD